MAVHPPAYGDILFVSGLDQLNSSDLENDFTDGHSEKKTILPLRAVPAVRTLPQHERYDDQKYRTKSPLLGALFLRPTEASISSLRDCIRCNTAVPFLLAGWQNLREGR